MAVVVSEKAAESAESYLKLSDSNPVAAQGILETFPGAVLTLLRGLLGFGRCPAAAGGERGVRFHEVAAYIALRLRWQKRELGLRNCGISRRIAKNRKEFRKKSQKLTIGFAF